MEIPHPFFPNSPIAPHFYTVEEFMKVGENKRMVLLFLIPDFTNWKYGTVMDRRSQEHIKEAIMAFPELEDREEDYCEKIPNKFISFRWKALPLPQVVPNSFVEWMKQAGVDLSFDLAPEFAGSVRALHDQDEALKAANVV